MMNQRRGADPTATRIKNTIRLILACALFVGASSVIDSSGFREMSGVYSTSSIGRMAKGNIFTLQTRYKTKKPQHPIPDIEVFFQTTYAD